jgi:hypothetical protein
LKGQDDGATDPPDEDSPFAVSPDATLVDPKTKLLVDPPDYGTGADNGATHPEPATDYTTPTGAGVTDPPRDADDPAETGPYQDPLADAEAAVEPMEPPPEEDVDDGVAGGGGPLQGLLRDASVAEEDPDYDDVLSPATHKMVYDG